MCIRKNYAKDIGKDVYMECILPFCVDVEMRMYHNKAFPLGIIKANISNYDIWLCNKLINCVCRKSGAFDSYEEDLWSVRDGLTFSQNIYLTPHSFELDGIDIVEFNKSMLMSGYYITGGYNEYYIPRKVAYKNFDFNHDYVIFGYDEKKKVFKSAAYLNDGSYSCYDIEYNDYFEAVTKNIVNKTSVNYYLINSNYIAQIDIETIKSKLNDYLHSKSNKNESTSGEIFGLSVWDKLSEYVSTVDEELDVRYSRAYMEHHNLMLKRIQTLLKYKYIKNNSLEKEYQDIFSNTRKVQNMFIKYNISKNRDLLSRISDTLRMVTCAERRVIKLLIDDIDTK